MAEEIRERLARVRERIERAAQRAGRDPEEITLITVSKTIDPITVQQAVDAGVGDLGENRVQEAAAKVGRITGDVRWHLIGHLQSNKARLAVETFAVIHTIDSVELAQRLDRIAGEIGRRPVVLIQVDLGHEPAKSGADESELPRVIDALDSARHLDFRGLMTLPPFFDSPETTRPFFVRLRELSEALNRSRRPDRRLTELSMGMSNDFEVAIEEGATMVRVGTAIFGSRKATD
ncbi:MAG TPA: YggS family pyridoxal phosphate-dependent enzyme [Blastocatellia bacterium]|nr:YggS family pyridoxal phosphate-dependent enzyme [Blastocatellia bacterium]